ncbi:hypothetical protein EOB36_31400 [Mesorhizobium sp. M6A.T.Cr.TU.017.01.1.1]|uniref:hypothetical protein n=1 Tax=Mesorhizobium sp. M6A.T.Cr.TU.017.01.1.1 TaxID=2496774 RepID=UPI000FD1F559|nr:hypothetical protein [Mesorhizobium sp. M6A.T.Cr.TU.017.01.1.1]RUU95889.1 hypothetical protein EOB36_31400 [Mesorhizobium sp. M6A.T.Cr.TU.017.01.1.1]
MNARYNQHRAEDLKNVLELIEGRFYQTPGGGTFKAGKMNLAKNTGSVERSVEWLSGGGSTGHACRLTEGPMLSHEPDDRIYAAVSDERVMEIEARVMLGEYQEGKRTNALPAIKNIPLVRKFLNWIAA